jgi:hypothetical protein
MIDFKVLLYADDPRHVHLLPQARIGVDLVVAGSQLRTGTCDMKPI